MTGEALIYLFNHTITAYSRRYADHPDYSTESIYRAPTFLTQAYMANAFGKGRVRELSRYRRGATQASH